MVELEPIKITDIVPADYNPRKISDEEYTKLKNSIETFGLVDPIIINLKNMHIVGGHQRYDVLLDQHMQDNDFFLELQMLRLGDVGFVFSDTDLSIENEDYEKALNLALNKISGEWDIPKLQNILTDLNLKHFDVELTGFGNLELNALLVDEQPSTNIIKGTSTISSKETGAYQTNSQNNAEFIPEDEPEFDETIANDVPVIICPRCGYELPKK